MKYFSQLAFICTFVFTCYLLSITSCTEPQIKVLNIGYIGPVTMMRASNFGDAPSKAIKLAIDYYNKSKEISQPYINFYIEDDKWEKGKAIPLYNKLRAEHNIDILFISNTGGTEALQEKIMTDNVILINPLHSNELLSSLNHNTFKIAKQTEEAYGLVGNKIVELGFNKVYIIHVADDLMTRGAMAVEKNI